MDETLVNSPLNGMDLVTVGSKVMENFSIIEVNSEFLEVASEVLRLTHPIFKFFMVFIFFFVHRQNLNLVLLTFHHFFIVNKSISIGIVVLEHPTEFEEIIEIIEDHGISKT